MKSITVYGSDEIIDDIKNTAWKLKMSASRYMIQLHAMKQEKAYPGEVRGSNVAGETITPDKRLLMKATDAKPKKTIQEIRDEVDKKVQSMTGRSGSYSKAQQTGGRGK